MRMVDKIELAKIAEEVHRDLENGGLVEARSIAVILQELDRKERLLSIRNDIIRDQAATIDELRSRPSRLAEENEALHRTRRYLNDRNAELRGDLEAFKRIGEYIDNGRLDFLIEHGTSQLGTPWRDAVEIMSDLREARRRVEAEKVEVSNG